MKVITKMELQPDMVLGEDILDQDRVIYPAGTTITPQIIEKLKRYNLVCVTIMEDVDFATTHYAKIRFDTNFKAFERAYPLFLGQYKLATPTTRWQKRLSPYKQEIIPASQARK